MGKTKISSLISKENTNKAGPLQAMFSGFFYVILPLADPCQAEVLKCLRSGPKSGISLICPLQECGGVPGPNSGSEKGVFWRKGLFRKVHFLEILGNVETVGGQSRDDLAA